MKREAVLQEKIRGIENDRDSTKQKLDIAIQERDAARRRLECFDCFAHNNEMYIFTPCAHKVCSECIDRYSVFTPCPTCSAKIMGYMKLPGD